MTLSLKLIGRGFKKKGGLKDSGKDLGKDSSVKQLEEVVGKQLKLRT